MGAGTDRFVASCFFWPAVFLEAQALYGNEFRPNLCPDSRIILNSMRASYVLGAILAALILVVLLVIAVLAPAAARCEHAVTGMWIGSTAFLARAGLRDFQLYIGPRENGARQSYLLIADDRGGLLANQALEIRYGGGLRRWWSGAKTAFAGARAAEGGKEQSSPQKSGTYRVIGAEFAYDSAPPPELPTVMNLALSAADGSLTLYDDEKVYAFLYKDMQASSAANEAYHGDE